MLSRLGCLPEQYGIVTAVFEREHAQKLAELGAGSIRLGFEWDEVQKDGPDDWNWAAYDDFVQRARDQRLKIFATVAYTPGWANGNAGKNRVPTDYATWYVYVRKVIERYGKVGDVTFGIWNEPDLQLFLDPNTPQTYAELFRYANAARLVVNPNVPLGAPETTVSALTQNNWLHNVLGLIEGLLRPQDVITVHYYGGMPLEQYMDSVIAAAGFRETWLTETGYDGGTTACPAQEPGQRAWLTDLINVFDGRFNVSPWKKVFPYVLHNLGETCEGLVRPNWTNKPAFDAYRDRIPHSVWTISLKASNGQYVVAPDAIFSVLEKVKANAATPGKWGVFTLTDLNGHPVKSGDWVLLATREDGRVLRADKSNHMKADRKLPFDWFIIEPVGFVPIGDGSQVSLRFFRTGRYASLDGDELNVEATTVGASETFTLEVH